MNVQFLAGARLRDERLRLGMNQTAFSALGGVSLNTQVRYESGERHPDAVYLAALAAHGIDVLYVLTGTRSGNVVHLPSEEQELLSAYRTAPKPVQEAIKTLASAFFSPRVG